MAILKVEWTYETIVWRSTMLTYTFPWPCRVAASKNTVFGLMQEWNSYLNPKDNNGWLDFGAVYLLVKRFGLD